jgi:phosphatidylinositol alpha-1,6-mannosyltransferase
VVRTLVVTNDFPTRQGGIESFVHALCVRFPPGEVVVHTAAMPGDAAVDAALPFPVVRDPTGTLLPTPAASRRIVATLRDYGCDRVLFGAAASLGLLAPALREAGATRIVGLTHGHEVWWAAVPGARQALRRIGEGCDVLTYVSRWCRDRIAPALDEAAAARMQPLSPGVDTSLYRPGAGGAQLRAEEGIAVDRPVLLCVARLVPRKGQDTLIAALPRIRDAVPGVLLVLVGGGPYRRALEEQAARAGVAGAVRFVGPVPWERTRAWFDAGDVFAMPCRTRLAGLEPEAFGIVFLEAQASGLPVIVGDSGGAPETVDHGVTGFVVDPHLPQAVAALAVRLLTDPQRAREMGRRGREWARRFEWDEVAARLRRILGHPG